MAINQDKFKKAVNDLIDSYSQEYKDNALLYSSYLLEALNKGDDITKALNYANSVFNFTATMESLLIGHMLKAAAYGYGIQPDMIAKPATLQRSFLNETWTSDKMTLSKRLHGNNIQMRTTIIDTVTAAMKQAKSFVEMARDLYKGYGKGGVIKQADLPEYLSKMAIAARKVASGDVLAYKEFQTSLGAAKTQVAKLSGNGAPTKALKAAYTDLIKAAEKLQVKALDKAVNTAVQERSRYYSERISRTEIARAFAEGVVAKTMDDPDVVGYRWTLGSRHPRFDICDFHANADIFGMGAGIFPKGKLPDMPAHPHCHCYPREVTIGSAEADDGKFSKQAGDDYLNSLDPAELKNLMNSSNVSDFRNGGNWEKLLNNYNGYDGMKPRVTPSVMDGEHQ